MKSYSIKNDVDHKHNLYLSNHLRSVLCVSEHDLSCEEKN